MKFKIGDWVRISGTIQRVVEINPPTDYAQFFDIDMVETEDDYVSAEVVELWQPKEGEWCWYKNNLVKIIDITDCIYVKATPASFMDRFVFFADFLECEPFIGQLPSSVKENK